MSFQELWVGADGERLKTYLHNPSRGARVIIMCHGFSGNSSGPLGTTLAELLSSEYFVCRFDFRGQGQSEGRFYDSCITRELEDLDRIVSYVRKQYAPRELILIGHSFGAAIALLYAADHHIDRLILLSGEGDLAKAVPLEFNDAQLADMGRKGETLVTNWSLGDENNDDLLGRQFLDDLRSYSTIDAADKTSVPTLLLHGTADDVVPCPRSEELHKHINGSTFVPLPGADHTYGAFSSQSRVGEAAGHILKWLRGA